MHGSKVSDSADPEDAAGILASIVIPARNEAPLIGECLHALAAQTVGARTLQVIVVAAGDDDTAGASGCAGADAHFGRLEILHLARGNKNEALQLGCSHATAPLVILLDADTLLADDAVEELARALSDGCKRAVHGAALPRYNTWISRYWELNRKLVKDLRFDGSLSGELIALRRATLARYDLRSLFPSTVGAQDDLYLGRELAARGCTVGYVAAARATTLVPWTLAGLAATMFRSRRGLMAIVPFSTAATQAAVSAMVVSALPVAIVAARWSLSLGAVCIAPLVAHIGRLAYRVGALRRSGLGDYRRDLPRFLVLDLLGRALKLVAFGERVSGHRPPCTFRGERPNEPSPWSLRTMLRPRRAP